MGECVGNGKRGWRRSSIVKSSSIGVGRSGVGSWKKMKGGGVVMNPGIVEKKTERVECGKRRGGSEEGDEWFEIG